jgi:hypothetical protein
VIAAYLAAREAVIAAGYESEIAWQAGVRLDDVTEQMFLRDFAFVVCNSGMRASVIAGLWPRLRTAFYDFAVSEWLVIDRASCRAHALAILNSPPKIDAILDAAARVHGIGWPVVHRSIREGGVAYLGTFKYMGPIIRWHLAKNLGLPVAKPDRHLVRIAAAFGQADVQAFCGGIAAATGDPIAVVDLVLWRFASTLRPGDYLAALTAPAP